MIFYDTTTTWLVLSLDGARNPAAFFKLVEQGSIESCRIPPQYVMRRRVEVAKALLQDSDLDIGRIALSIGLRSQSHFADIFQRHTGMTPTRFRRLVET